MKLLCSMVLLCAATVAVAEEDGVQPSGRSLGFFSSIANNAGHHFVDSLLPNFNRPYAPGFNNYYNQGPYNNFRPGRFGNRRPGFPGFYNRYNGFRG